MAFDVVHCTACVISSGPLHLAAQLRADRRRRATASRNTRSTCDTCDTCEACCHADGVLRVVVAAIRRRYARNIHCVGPFLPHRVSVAHAPLHLMMTVTNDSHLTAHRRPAWPLAGSPGAAPAVVVEVARGWRREYKNLFARAPPRACMRATRMPPCTVAVALPWWRPAILNTQPRPNTQQQRQSAAQE